MSFHIKVEFKAIPGLTYNHILPALYLEQHISHLNIVSSHLRLVHSLL